MSQTQQKVADQRMVLGTLPGKRSEQGEAAQDSATHVIHIRFTTWGQLWFRASLIQALLKASLLMKRMVEESNMSRTFRIPNMSLLWRLRMKIPLRVNDMTRKTTWKNLSWSR